MSISTYRSNIIRLTKEKADLEKSVGQVREKISKLQKDIASITHSMTHTTSRSNPQSKQQQLGTKQKELANCQKKVAELEAKIADKLTALQRNLNSAERAGDRERKKQDTETNHRHDKERRHVKEISRETQRQAQLHSTMSKHPLVIDIARLPLKIKVLFLAANPYDQNALRLDEEVRMITEKIRLSEYRDSVELISRWAVRTSDLLQALNEHKPHIVHFSGHGSPTGEILFQAEDGGTKFVPKEAIVATMSTMADNVRLVLFNTCFSGEQAAAVTKCIDAAIGMNTEIGDEEARVFASQFYSAIGFGLSIQQAFDQAKARLLLEDIPENDLPELFVREDVDPNTIILVRLEQNKLVGENVN